MTINAEKQGKKDKQARPFKGAALQKTVSLRHEKAQNAIRRTFDIVGRHSYFISARATAILKSDTDVLRVEEHLENTLKNQLKLLEKLKGRLVAVQEAEGITGEAVYSNAKKFEVMIVTGFQKRYLNLLLAADETLSLIDTLCLEGAMTETERRKEILTVKRVINAVYNSSRNLQREILGRIALTTKMEIDPKFKADLDGGREVDATADDGSAAHTNGDAGGTNGAEIIGTALDASDILPEAQDQGVAGTEVPTKASKGKKKTATAVAAA